MSSIGQEHGFWVSGHIVYGSCVFVANVLLVLRSNTHTVQGVFFFSLMFAAYFVIFLFQAQFTVFPEIYGTFSQSFGSMLVWLIFLGTVFTTCIPELAVKYYHQYLVEKPSEFGDMIPISSSDTSSYDQNPHAINKEGGSREMIVGVQTSARRNSLTSYTPPANNDFSMGDIRY